MKGLVKGAARLFFTLLAIPFWLLYRIESAIIGKSQAFSGYSQLFSLIPGIIGVYFRFAFYKLTLSYLGADAYIGFGVSISNPNTRIGRGAYIGPFCNLGLCTIEDDVLLGAGVHIMSGLKQHGFDDLNVPIREQKGKLENIRIGRDSWVGSQAVIGAHIGEKCVIGAASFVNREIPAYSIAAGNPARVIRDRRQAIPAQK